MEKLLFTSESVTEGHPDKLCDAGISSCAFVIISPVTRMKPVQLAVSHATRLIGSCSIHASRMASEMASHILSGCPSVTDSDVNNNFSFCSFLSSGCSFGN